MIGPIMVGPSSSHMAGVVRIGQVAHKVMEGVPDQALVTFHNSLAHTYRGHGSDRGIVAGLMNFSIDDPRILNAHEHASEAGFSFAFSVTLMGATHPNTVRVDMKRRGRQKTLLGESTGGGMIQIIELDGYRCFFTGREHTLIMYAKDLAGNIAKISALLFRQQRNIANMTVNRREKKKEVLYAIEIDEAITDEELNQLRGLPSVDQVIYIPSFC